MNDERGSAVVRFTWALLVVLGLGIGALLGGWRFVTVWDGRFPEAHQATIKLQAEWRRLAAENQTLARELETSRRNVAAATRAAPGIIEEPSAGWNSAAMAVLTRAGGSPETAGFALGHFRASMRKRYTPLFAAMHLTAAEREAALRVLAEYAATRMDIATAGMAGAAVAPIFVRNDAELREQLAKVVGPERAPLFADAEQHLSEWLRIAEFQTAVTYEAASLTATQVRSLLNDWESMEPDQAARLGLSDEQAEAAMRERSQRVLQKASAYLTPAQLDSLARYNARRLQTLQIFLPVMRALQSRRN
jgi:hypothetical protein